MPLAGATEVKLVGKSGQISLGKAYAGKLLRLERHDDGSILLTAVAVVPESQLWTVTEPDRSRIAQGLAWARRTPPRETDLEQLVARASRQRGTRRGRRK